MQNKPRKTDYQDLEFRDMIRTVSDERRVYFTDVDFVAYVYDKNNKKQVPFLVIESKRKYQIANGIYNLTDSDKLVINLAKKLQIPFIFVFYESGKLSDNDEILIVQVREAVALINIFIVDEKKYMVYKCTVWSFKEGLKWLASVKSSGKDIQEENLLNFFKVKDDV